MLDGPKSHYKAAIAITTPEDGRKAVDMLKSRGVDFIKVQSGVPREAYFAIADEAKRDGIEFEGHVPDAIRASEAGAAGQHTFEHLICLGYLATAAGIYNLTRLDLNTAFGTVTLWRMLQVVGLPFIFIPISTLNYVGVPLSKTNQISSLSNFARTSAAAPALLCSPPTSPAVRRSTRPTSPPTPFPAASPTAFTWTA
jgi:hypothetical protein